MSARPSAGTLAGGRRFWITVACFAIVNAAAWVGYHKWVMPRKDILRVEHFQPGEGMVVGPRPQLSWRFNLDVKANKGEAPGDVRPAVAGRWSWSDARTLLFVPTESLPKATKLTVTLNPQNLRTAEGFVLAKPYSTTISTPALRLVSMRQGGIEEGNRYVIQLEFNDKVLGSDVASKLTLLGPGGKKLAFEPLGQAAGSIVRVLTEAVTGPTNKHGELLIHAHLNAGLCGVSGPLTMEGDYDTEVVLARILAITEISASSPARGEGEITLRANGEVDLEVAREVISVEPAARFRLSAGMYSGNSLRLVGDFKAGSRYAVKVSAAAAGTAREKVLKPDTLSILMPQREAGVWFENEQGYLGSHGNRTLLAHAINLPELKVSVWRVYDSNLVAWRNAAGRYRWRNDATELSEPVATKTIKLGGAKDQVQDVRLALDELLPAEQGRDGSYRISLRGTATEGDRYGYRGEDGEDGYELASATVTLSDIGLTAKASGEQLVAWAVSLSTAKPIPGVRVRAYSNKNQLLGEATTDSEGLARIGSMHPNKGEQAAVVLADQQGGALTWLDLASNEWGLSDIDISGRPYLRSGYEAFIYSERGVYRPGETVHLRAIVRDPGHRSPRPMPVHWQVRRPDLRDWRGQAAMLDGDGATSWELKLPEDLPTGRWSAMLGLPGSKEYFGSAEFLVEEFVPQRIKVVAAIGQETPGEAGIERRMKVGEEPVEVHVKADYLFGRPCAGLSTALAARIDRARFAPRAWDGWTFGDSGNTLDLLAKGAVGAVEAEAEEEQAEEDDGVKVGKDKSVRIKGETELDEAGKGRWKIDLGKVLEGKAKGMQYRGPWKLWASASVREMGGRAVTAGDGVMVDALPWYVGIRCKQAGAVRMGVGAEFEVKLAKPDGAASQVGVDLVARLYRETWNSTIRYRNGRYQYESQRKLDEVSGAAAQVKIREGAGSVRILPPGAGVYVLQVLDEATGAMSSVEFYASDGSPWDDSISRENPQRLELAILPAATQPSTRPSRHKEGLFGEGDAARVVVRSPFAGRLLLAVETDRVMETQVLEMTSSSMEVPLKILPAWRPNAYVTAMVLRPIDPEAKWRTHRAYGAVRLSVDPADHRLSIEVGAAQEMKPRQTLDVPLRITDAKGEAVAGTAVTVAAVDDGILQLTNFKTPDPLGYFHAIRALGVTSADLYSMLMPEVPKAGAVSAVGGDESLARHTTPVPGRRVKPVALVSGVLHTDAQGVAVAHFLLPEFTGRLRLMVVASKEDAFGSADAAVVVRSPLLIQPSFPRFAAPGDRFVVPLAIFNNANAAGEAQVKVEVVGDGDLLSVEGGGRSWASQPIHLEGSAQARLEMKLVVGEGTGVAHVRVTGTMGSQTYEENVEIPVRPAAPMITRGGFAAAAPGKPLKLEIPGGLLAGTDKTQIRVTPWPDLQLPEGLDYLERYPYGCAEQTISTCFPLIYLSDIGPKIAPGVFEKERVKEKLQLGIIRLMGMQTADGGLAMWPGERQSWPWASVYGAHLLVEAKRAGHDVPDDFERRLLNYVQHMIEKVEDGQELEAQAYACYVLALAGKAPRPTMSRLSELARSEGPGAKPAEAAYRTQARLYLSLAWMAAGRRDLADGLIPQALPPMRTLRESGGNIGSPVRDRAMLISALLQVEPQRAELPQLVQQLADAGKEGQWQSTQDCAFAVMAIGRYLRQFKARESYDRAELLSGEKVLASAGAKQNLIFATTRPSGELSVRLEGAENAAGYVGWIQSGVPLAPPGDADHGLEIRRRYLGESGEELPANTVRSGDAVIVELSVEGPAGQENIVIEDLLPAGLEVENPRLAGSADAGVGDGKAEELPLRVDVRDDRIVFVTDIPSKGQRVFRYAARAVTVGTFVLPPVRGECMYEIGTNSIYGSGRFSVLSADGNPPRRTQGGLEKVRPRPATPKTPVAGNGQRRGRVPLPAVY